MRSLRENVVTTKLHDEGPFLGKWNKLLLLSCITAVILDPLFFYTPFVDAQKLCIAIDKNVAVILCVARSLIDVFYIFHILLRFRTGFIAPQSRLYVDDSMAILKHYLQSHFVIDILSILPLPQLVIVTVIHAVRRPVESRPLAWLVIAQYLVRILRMVPLLNKVIKSSNLNLIPAWGGAAWNFCLYMLASHVIGAFWYIASVERAYRCWLATCGSYSSCYLFCGGGHHGSNLILNSSCSPLEPSKSDFDYGIYLNAIGFQLRTQFLRRFFYSFVWGLRNLSSLGQNLVTSDKDMAENCFVVVISFSGLILFSVLASNIQRYVQSLTAREDEMRLKLVDREQWMSRTMLPQDVRCHVRRHEQYKWEKSRGIDEESLICDLPKVLRRDIRRHQRWRLLCRVPMFERMDEQVKDALSCCMKRVFHAADSYIAHEGVPVDEMLFIEMGSVISRTKGRGERVSFNDKILKAGDFFGEELLTWALDANSSSSLPISTRTLRALDNVEAFSVRHDDLRSIISQYEHIFRFNFQQRRSWCAFIIQAAWRRYHPRKMERSLKIE